MNPGQEKFFNFILQRTQEGKTDEMKALLIESFTKQQTGEFSKEYLASFAPKMLSLINPQFEIEVQEIVQKFGQSHTN